MNLDETEQLAADMRAAHLIKTLTARIQGLEAMLDAVGAGGVSAQRIRQESDHIEQPRKMVAAQEPFATSNELFCEMCGQKGVRRIDGEALPDRLYAAPQPQADARDAQRYRWLRAQPLESDMFCTTIWRKGSDEFGDDLRLEKLDAVIDAAIAAQEGGAV